MISCQHIGPLKTRGATRVSNQVLQAGEMLSRSYPCICYGAWQRSHLEGSARILHAIAFYQLAQTEKGLEILPTARPTSYRLYVGPPPPLWSILRYLCSAGRTSKSLTSVSFLKTSRSILLPSLTTIRTLSGGRNISSEHFFPLPHSHLRSLSKSATK